MALIKTNVERVFMYDELNLPDPSPSMSHLEVLDHYSGMYPELISASVEVDKEEGKYVYTFSKNLGTKG